MDPTLTLKLDKFILLICFPFLLLASEGKYSVGPEAAWVKPCSFNADAPVKPSQIHSQHLLVDTQRNWEEKSNYIHRVIKLLDQTAVESFTNLQIEFDPSYQQLVVHQLQVLRNGACLDRLKTARSKLLQREEDLENNLYEGDVTLVYFLDDIRIGDIIEYAYTSVGEHPLFSNHLTDSFRMQDEVSIEKMVYRLLIDPDKTFSIKSFNTSIEPTIVDLAPNLHEWTWQALETEAVTRYHWEPSWYVPYARIQLSQYKNWHEVAQQTVPFFTLPGNFATQAMQEKVAHWKGKNPFEQAGLALRFVQDEVKYLGFEDDLGGFIPREPGIVFEKRFGDCKDKVFLLHALLKMMDIASVPVLVNTERGRKLPHILPASKVFNHVVLQITMGETVFYVDPVITRQGSSLPNHCFPEYDWGLMISDQTTRLIPLPKIILEKPTQIFTTLTLTAPDIASLDMKRHYYGFEAEYMRQRIENRGLKKLTQDFLEAAQASYRGATPLQPPSFSDDREKNVVTVEESYKIPIRRKSLQIYSHTLERYFDDSLDNERTSPYDLAYPRWVEEHIHIENPFHEWSRDSEEAAFDNGVISYQFHHQKQGHTADYHFELKHLQDHVPLDLVQNYWDIISEIYPNPSLDLILLTR